MNLFKILNIKTNKYKSFLDDDVKIILDRCEKIANIEYEDLKEQKELIDNRCPNCHAKKEHIVDKICNVNGVSKLSGFLNLNSIITITTEPINHCNKCGNEWKKFKMKYISKTDIVRIALIYLNAILIDSNEKKHLWKLETIQVFDGCNSESIYYLCMQNKKYLPEHTINKLKLSELRKNYKSIYGS